MKPHRREFSEQIGKKAARKRHARRTRDGSIWLGLGMFGVVGWSVVLPMLLGLTLGAWADRTWPGQISWTLTLMVAGLVVGCLNAWFWVTLEGHAIGRQKDREDQDDH